MGDFQQKITPLFLRSWFLTLVALCILVIVASLLLQLRRQNLQKHPEKELQRRKNQLLAADLNLVEQAYTAGNSLLFLGAARTAMQNQMGLSWNMAPTTISLTSLKDRLGSDAPLVEIFAAADAAAYGGATLSREKMQDYLQTMKKELEALP
jgi:ABC-type bacteriocin/lantibiotic exporter with double-glycine peptidase domain